jgi:hypothetical protein
MNCPICYEDYNTRRVTTITKCNHKFHRNCLETWKNRSNSCPICRQNIIAKCTLQLCLSCDNIYCRGNYYIFFEGEYADFIIKYGKCITQSEESNSFDFMNILKEIIYYKRSLNREIKSGMLNLLL